MGKSSDEFNSNENDDENTEESSDGKWRQFAIKSDAE
jgi:hypothetical protein